MNNPAAHVSVPSRGNGFLNAGQRITGSIGTTVSVPSRGNGFLNGMQLAYQYEVDWLSFRPLAGQWVP